MGWEPEPWILAGVPAGVGMHLQSGERGNRGGGAMEKSCLETSSHPTPCFLSHFPSSVFKPHTLHVQTSNSPVAVAAAAAATNCCTEGREGAAASRAPRSAGSHESPAMGFQRKWSGSNFSRNRPGWCYCVQRRIVVCRQQCNKPRLRRRQDLPRSLFWQARGCQAFVRGLLHCNQLYGGALSVTFSSH